MAAPRAAGPTRDDVDALALALPEVTREGTPEHPAYAVRGKKFLLWRGPRKDAVDPDTGERLPDVIAVACPARTTRRPSCRAGRRGSRPPLRRLRLRARCASATCPTLDDVELAEVITDAWASRAPKRLVKDTLG